MTRPVKLVISEVDGAPNYMRAVAAYRKIKPLPTGLYDMEIRHDDDCAALAGGLCRCRPDLWLGGKCVAITRIAKNKAGA